jgi:tetratricopeptide (TPR) repeat protein
MKPLLAIFCLTFLVDDAWSQPPSRPNTIDDDGLKQGEWVYYFNAKWKKTKRLDRVTFYRLVTYENSKPIGQVVDYYLDGKVQMLADSLISEDPEQYHGVVLGFSEEGYVNQVNVYQNGSLDTAQTIHTFIEYIEKYKIKIPTHLDLAYLANDLAFLYVERKNYERAESYHSLARTIRANQLGTRHIQYAISCYKLAYSLKMQYKYDHALKLFEEAANVFLEKNGKRDKTYARALEHIEEIKDIMRQ